MSRDPLEAFAEPTRRWFEASFQAATAAQLGAWRAIDAGRHVLVVAPTGSGKTLAAFLWAIDRMMRSGPTIPMGAGRPPSPAAQTAPPPATRGARVLYISPLKALGVDVQRNLHSPLVGIRHAADRLGVPTRDVRVAVRSGDTPQADRRRLVTHPPDVLITTPESLYLMLTSNARDSLRTVETVVVDEVHAICTTKRGAHLAVSLERLDALLERPAQRIGLSATVRPVETVAAFLGGAAPVTVVQPTVAKEVDVTVVVPVPDMTDPGMNGTVTTGAGRTGAGPTDADDRGGSLWPSVENRIVDLVREHRSTLVFANSRRLAERLCSRMNARAAELAEAARQVSEQEPGQVTEPDGAATPATVIARAHHGSVSREERLGIEESLKRGALPAVVATSSLELGIDMGAVDLVIQVEPPPSVAAGLQRIGRSGHQVGALSRGVVFPKHRGDLVPCAVTARRMTRGEIESMTYVSNPLDVLAQQVVAMVSMDDWSVTDLATVLRSSAPFAALPDSALRSVLDMLTGRYPSDDFTELKPRLIWDRTTDVLRARPGAHRVAVTSGGTIPDRGLFGVFLAGSDAAGSDAAGGGAAGLGPAGAGGRRGGGRRVGELDEEMVYESRVGDVFLLGSTSWRIVEITPERVLVVPAPGEPGKMPFWHGDSPGRPPELGRAVGAFVREISSLDRRAAESLLADSGLDPWARSNLLAYLDEQRAATGHLPDDRTVVVERCRDELGDWRIAVHTPMGSHITAPWALAAVARMREALGVEISSVHTDDGIVLRVPDMPEPPPTELLVLDPDEVEALVVAQVGGSALFASRFRECAARSLLLPRRDPGRRTPLWQQRQRASGLLQVASRYPEFPVVLEAMRECIRDVYDIPALVALMREIRERRVRVVDVETPGPSPFARSLLFSYVGTFLYEGDLPLAERRAQALAVDSAVLAELLGSTDLRELLDATALEDVEAEAQGVRGALRARDVESTADLLRRVGDMTDAEAFARGVEAWWLTELERQRRAVRVRIAREERWIAVEDAARVRDGLGCALPPGIPHVLLEPVDDPLGDLVARYARTHAPFPAVSCARRLGLGPAVVTAALRRLAARGRVSYGAFTPGGGTDEWVDVDVLRRVRRRSLARLRRQVEAVPPATLGAFLPQWQHMDAPLRGHEGVYAVIEQLQGAALPASALETLILPGRVDGYEPRLLDDLCTGGDVVWAGVGALPGNDGWVSLAPADSAAAVLPGPADPGVVPAATGRSPLHQAVLAAMPSGDAVFFRTVVSRVRELVPERGVHLTEAEVADALWDLVWDGIVSNDTLTPLRARLARRRNQPGRAVPTHHARSLGSRARPYGGGTRARQGADTSGRWARLPERSLSATERLTATSESLLERYGIVTRGVVATEDVVGGFGAVYPVLRAFEDAGHCRRGYFLEGLGAAQFALPGAADRLRACTAEASGAVGPRARLLAAADPANPYGSALPWPARPGDVTGTGGHRPGRKAGALVVLVDGHLALYVERGGHSLLTFTEDAVPLAAAARELAAGVAAGHLGTLAVSQADGAAVHHTPHGQVTAALEAAGFRPTPRGLRLRAP